MSLVAARCTQCGANITVDSSKDAGICPHCNTAYIVEKAIKDFIFFCSAIYTLVSMGIIFVLSALPGENNGIEMSRFVYILLFSATVSIGCTVWRIETVNRTFAAITHAVCFIGGLAVFLALCDMGFSATVILTAVFAVIYTISTVISRGLIKKNRKATPNTKKTAKASSKPAKEAEYKKLFNKD